MQETSLESLKNFAVVGSSLLPLCLCSYSVESYWSKRLINFYFFFLSHASVFMKNKPANFRV